MRFLAILRKELRECLPWIVLAAAVLFAFGYLELFERMIPQNVDHRYRLFTPSNEVYHFDLMKWSLLAGIGQLLLFVSIGLGLAMGIRQFWVDHYTGTWGLTLHRSVNKEKILSAKLTAAAIGFVVSVGAIWCLLFLYASKAPNFYIPPTKRAFFEGWVYIASGLVVYLGTALAGLSTVRWYTTKVFGLAFAAVILFVMVLQGRLSYAYLTLLVGIFILAVQIGQTFLSREF
jgi:hypothetical protein